MKESTVEDQRLRFVRAVEDGACISSACSQFGISRVTGYKILNRFAEQGVAGLSDRSRAPLGSPHRTSQESEDEVLALKGKHPSWGPKKLRASLLRAGPGGAYPASSTIGDILKRAGLVRARRRSPGSGPHPRGPLTAAAGCNHVWCIDYKGQFRLGDGQWCYPLTITDDASRFLIRCQGLPDTRTANAWPRFVGAFQEFGLPEIIRSDNGAPFAAASLTGLSKLSLRFVKLGIVHERMEPGRPTQNARHERMHRTLKAEAASPPSARMSVQQERMDAWRASYNNERPHEGIGMRVPNDLYAPSPRPFPASIPALEYPSGFRVAKVRPNGCMRWRGGELFVSEVLAGENIGLDHFDDRLHALYVGAFPVAILDDTAGALLAPKEAATHLKALRCGNEA